MTNNNKTKQSGKVMCAPQEKFDESGAVDVDDNILEVIGSDKSNNLLDDNNFFIVEDQDDLPAANCYYTSDLAHGVLCNPKYEKVNLYGYPLSFLIEEEKSFPSYVFLLSAQIHDYFFETALFNFRSIICSDAFITGVSPFGMTDDLPVTDAEFKQLTKITEYIFDLIIREHDGKDIHCYQDITNNLWQMMAKINLGAWYEPSIYLRLFPLDDELLSLNDFLLNNLDSLIDHLNLFFEKKDPIFDEKVLSEHVINLDYWKKVIKELEKNKDSIHPMAHEKIIINKKIPLNEKITFINQGDLFSIINDKENKNDEQLVCIMEALKKNQHLWDKIGFSKVDKSMLVRLDELAVSFPNFYGVIDHLKNSLYLSLLSPASPLCFKPILLLGDAGVGKTAFCRRLSGVLGIAFDMWAAPQITDSFEISGHSMGWKNGKEGKLFSTVARHNIVNPLILIDEIDKLNAHRSNVETVFLQLFEKENSKDFYDEALKIRMDASSVNWIASANYPDKISKPLLSRMKVFEIKMPSKKEMRNVISSIYKELRSEQISGDKFSETVESDIVDLMIDISPRKIKALLENSMALTANKYINSNAVLSDIKIDKSSVKQVMDTTIKSKKIGYDLTRVDKN